MRWWLTIYHPPCTNEVWKFVDNTSLSEKIRYGDVSHIQSSVDEIQSWTRSNNAKKELRIDFTRKTPVVGSFTPISINNRNFDIVDHAKNLGMLKWNKHVASVVLKASRRLPLIPQTSQSAKQRHCTNLLCACIRPILKYAAPVYHDSLPQYLNVEIERVQKRCLRRIFSRILIRWCPKASLLFHTMRLKIECLQEALCWRLHELWSQIAQSYSSTKYVHVLTLNSQWFTCSKLSNWSI